MFCKTKTRLEVEKDGFHGVYWENKKKSEAAIILMLGDDCEDMLAKGGAKWAVNKGLNALTMSPQKKDYGHHNYPLERFESAIAYLKKRGNKKIAIAGASTTGTLSLLAASYFSDITLTLAFTPSDFVWQGFMCGKKDGCDEWPVEGEAIVSYRGKPLPYMPFAYKHPDYWHVIKEESKQGGDMVASRKLFGDSEKASPITEDMFIKIENIKGKLVFVGTEDDALWDTCRYIRRAMERLSARPHECKAEAFTYEHGTHLAFPQSMLKTFLPVGGGLFIKMMFSAGRKYPKECKATRLDLDKKIIPIFKEWINEK